MPTIVSVIVSAWWPSASSTIWVMPKSSTLTVPSAAYAMLPGLMSRWTMPASWAAWRALGDLVADGPHVLDRQRTLVADLLGQRRSREELHDEVCRVVLDARVVDGDDVGVVQGSGRPGLAAEALPRVVALGTGEVEGLDGDLATEHLVLRRATRRPCRHAPRGRRVDSGRRAAAPASGSYLSSRGRSVDPSPSRNL